jgi:hypothetical protein
MRYRHSRSRHLHMRRQGRTNPYQPQSLSTATRKPDSSSFRLKKSSRSLQTAIPIFQILLPHRQAHVLPSHLQLATPIPPIDKPETRHASSSSALLERLKTYVQALPYPLHDLIVPRRPCALHLHMFACCAGRATCRDPTLAQILAYVVAFGVGGVLSVKGVGWVDLELSASIRGLMNGRGLYCLEKEKLRR